MITVYVYRNGETQVTDRIDPKWVDPASGVTLWVDIAQPTADEGEKILRQTFQFPSALDRGRAQRYSFPEDRELRPLSVRHPSRHRFPGAGALVRHARCRLFSGDNYLVTVHDGQSRSIQKLKELCQQHARILEEGPVALMHRIVDSMVDNYEPELDELEREMDRLEEQAVLGAGNNLMRPILAVKRDSVLRSGAYLSHSAMPSAGSRDGSFRSSRARWRIGSGMSTTTWCATSTK
jgi:magnesium transporter